MAKKKLSKNDVVTLLNPETFRAQENEDMSDPLGKTRIPVTIDQLRPSDLNPRKSRNPKYDDIKESIRNMGLNQIPKITRRHPDDPYFMIKGGGNTRLQILRELWEETGDERFYRIECDFSPWEGDIRELVENVAENEERGELLFIEKANAAAGMRRLFEEQEGAPISGRELARRITESGWTLNQAHLTRYEYAVNVLLPAIPTALWAGMGHPQVGRLRKLDNAYRKYWQHQEAGQQNPDGFGLIWHDVLAEHDAESLDFEAIQKALDIAVGEALGIHYQTVAIECDALASGIPLNSAPGGAIEPPEPGPGGLNTGGEAGGHGASPSGTPEAGGVSHETETASGAAANPLAKLEQIRQKAAARQQTGSGDPGNTTGSTGLSLEELRHRALELARELAEPWEIGDLVTPIDFGAGFILQRPNSYLNDQTLQGGTFMRLYRLALAGVMTNRADVSRVEEPELLLKSVFENPFYAVFAEITCTAEILAPDPNHPNYNLPKLLALRTGFRELEELIIEIADEIRESRG